MKEEKICLSKAAKHTLLLTYTLKFEESAVFVSLPHIFTNIIVPLTLTTIHCTHCGLNFSAPDNTHQIFTVLKHTPVDVA